VGRPGRLIAVAAPLLLFWIVVVARVNRQEIAAGIVVVAIATAVHVRTVRGEGVRLARSRMLRAAAPLPWQVVRGTAVVLRAAIRPSPGVVEHRSRHAPDRPGRLIEVWAASLAPDSFIVAAGGEEVLEHRLGS
jgi:multisubunit Na+/H+ antiporter MnhE subunit